MARLFRSLGWAFAVPLVGALAMLLASCANPTTTPTAGTISGRIYDSSTGAGLSGATVSIGSYSATTNSSGNYTIALASGATSASGNLAITDGSRYEFIYEQGATISTTGGSATLNMPLSPSNATVTAQPTPVVVSGTAAYLDGTALSSSDSVQLTIVNQNGSLYSANDVLANSGSYSISIPALGTNCFVAVTLSPSSSSTSGEPTESYYLKNVSLDSSMTLNLKPPASGTTVSLSGGSNGSSVIPELNVPGYGLVPVAGAQLTSATGTISVYDPGGYTVTWGQMVTSTSSAPGTEQVAFAAPAVLGTTVTLPGFTEPTPTTYPDMSSATYSNGTIDFTPSTDAMGTLLQFFDSANGQRGIVWATGNSITLPTAITNLFPTSSSTTSPWGVRTVGGNLSGMDPIPIFQVLTRGLYPAGISSEVSAGAFQAGFSAGSNSNLSNFPD